MSKLILYPERARRGTDCSKMKRQVIPNQSMSLKEIIKRFVRREALPVTKEGTYHESDHDLEKVMTMDVVEKQELLAQVKEDVRRKKKVVDDFRKFEEEQKRAKGQPDPNPPPPPDPPKG